MDSESEIRTLGLTHVHDSANLNITVPALSTAISWSNVTRRTMWANVLRLQGAAELQAKCVQALELHTITA